jgi:cysteine-rich repeat protein
MTAVLAPERYRSVPSPRICLAALSIALLGLHSPTASAALTVSQQACVEHQNASFRHTAAVIGAEASRCLARRTCGEAECPTGEEIRSCVADDASGAIADVAARAAEAFDTWCSGEDADGEPRKPLMLATDAAATTDAARKIGGDLLSAALGSDAGAETLCDATDSAGATCQRAVLRRLRRCQQRRLREFNRCKGAALAGGGELAAVAACLGADPDGRIAAACGDTGGNDVIRRGLQKRCLDQGVDLADAFPHCTGSTLEEVHACLAAPIACSVCEALNRVDRLGSDCDRRDGGSWDGSCGCGDTVTAGFEECDDGNREDGDGCSAACELEDRDGDGILNDADNCPTIPNPDQDASACDCPCFGDGDLTVAPSACAENEIVDLFDTIGGCPSLGISLIEVSYIEGYAEAGDASFSAVRGLLGGTFCNLRIPACTATPITMDQYDACRALIVSSRSWKAGGCPLRP